MTKTSYNCEKCNDVYQFKNLIYHSGKYICRNCIRKLKSTKNQLAASMINKGRVSLAEVLSRTYILVPQNNNQIFLTLPICMINRKFKIVLVHDEDEIIQETTI